MIFNKNSSSLLPRKKSNKINIREEKKNIEEFRGEKKGQKGKTKAKRIERNSRGLKEISQTVILLVWRLGDRPKEKKRTQKKKKSEQFLHPSGARRMKIHTFCLKMNFFIAFSFFLSAINPRIAFSESFSFAKSSDKSEKTIKTAEKEPERFHCKPSNTIKITHIMDFGGRAEHKGDRKAKRRKNKLLFVKSLNIILLGSMGE